MKKTYESNIYIYEDAIPKRSEHLLPNVLTFDNPTRESVLLRLLLGTLNVTNKLDDIHIKQRINYSHLGMKTVTNLSKKSLADCQLNIYEDIDNFNRYIRRNRRNTAIFENLLFEYTSFIHQKMRKAHISGFVHLYRCIEYISYTFPLIYASKSTDYKGTFDALSSFFSNQKSELKFFKKFQETLIGNDVLSLTVSLPINAPNVEMIDKFKSIITNNICRGILFDIRGNTLILEYKDLFDFIITLRNRYFHMLEGDGKRNIKEIDVSMDLFFETVNEVVANWIAYIYFEITKFGLENN
ncbi:hypothetical protein OBCHQ24_04870 [Oceanobacillus iheyensis]|nr:hypothetical protein OBCHQ24_04870 [Oceanobacillus iheyensis]